MTVCSSKVHYEIRRRIYAGNSYLLVSSETSNFFFFPKHCRSACASHTHISIPLILWVGLHGCKMCTYALGERTDFKCLETKY